MEEQRSSSNTKKQENGKTRKMTWDIRPYLAVGLTVVLVVVVCMAIFFVVLRFDGLAKGIGKVLNNLQAILIGFVVAYLLNPVMKLFERILKKRMYRKSAQKTPRQRRTIRAVAVALSLGVFLALIAVQLWLILPELIRSINDLVQRMGQLVQNLTDWINSFLRQDSPFAHQLDKLVEDVSVYLEDWLRKNFLNGSSDWIASVTTGVYNVVRTAFNAVIGLIISVYVLMTKETFIGQAKKIIYAVFRPKYGNVTVEVIRKANDIFGGFFIGKIIDSIIIGFLCLAGVYIMRMPYAVLVSVIVGVTNVIPFFGPYIGAIPSFILIVLENPLKGLYFLIFIFILQQVDGNVIGPKILGDTTGLSPFWVVFAILLFGGSFGIVGMIFGVPIFALIYYLVKRVVDHILRVRKLPNQTLSYINLDKVNLQDNTLEEKSEEEKEKPIFHRNIQKLGKFVKGRKKNK